MNYLCNFYVQLCQSSIGFDGTWNVKALSTIKFVHVLLVVCVLCVAFQTSFHLISSHDVTILTYVIEMRSKSQILKRDKPSLQNLVNELDLVKS